MENTYLQLINGILDIPNVKGFRCYKEFSADLERIMITFEIRVNSCDLHEDKKCFQVDPYILEQAPADVLRYLQNQLKDTVKVVTLEELANETMALQTDSSVTEEATSRSV